MNQDRSIDRFVELLKFPQVPVKEEIEEEIDELDHEELIPVLIEIISSTDKLETKKAAILSLEYLAGSDSLYPLLDLILNDNSVELRLTAIKTVALLKSKAALDTLNKVVNRSDNEQIIQMASQAIQIIQGITPAYSLSDI